MARARVRVRVRVRVRFRVRVRVRVRHDLEPDAKHQALVGQPIVQGGALAPRQEAQELHVGERDLVGVGVGVR